MTAFRWLCLAWGVAGAAFIAAVAVAWIRTPSSRELADANDRAVRAEQLAARLAGENRLLRADITALLESRYA